MPGAVKAASLFAALLGALLAAAYLPSLRGGYTNWDDPDYTHSSRMAGGASAADALTSPALGHYHPLTELSMRAEAVLLGERAGVRRAVSFSLHLANAVLLFLFLSALGLAPPAAAAGALLWALHPAQAESAAWIAERKNLLYVFFYLSAMLAYLGRSGAGGRGAGAAVWALFALSLLSKAPAVTLPLALLGLDWLKGRPLDRENAAEKGLMLALALCFALLASAAQGQNGRLLPAGPAALFSFYLGKALWPAGLSPLYPYAEALAELKGQGAAALLPAGGFIAALLLLLKTGRRTAAFGLFFFAANMLPFSLIIPTGPALAADRYLYLPLAGLALAAAALGAEASRGKLSAAAVAASLLLAAGGEFIMTRRAAAAWAGSEPLWRAVLERYPSARTARLNLASALLEKGPSEEAAGLLAGILRDDPGDAAALYNLGTLLAMGGDPLGEAMLARSARLDPSNHLAAHNLALINLRAGRHGAAAALFGAALAARPGYSPSLAGLAKARLGAGDCAGAREAWAAAAAAGGPGGASFGEEIGACR
ncbi:MAG: hypothetical protein AB1734_04890 [Elusimicrobiota bacterium]